MQILMHLRKWIPNLPLLCQWNLRGGENPLYSTVKDDSIVWLNHVARNNRCVIRLCSCHSNIWCKQTLISGTLHASREFVENWRAAANKCFGSFHCFRLVSARLISFFVHFPFRAGLCVQMSLDCAFICSPNECSHESEKMSKLGSI